MKCRLRSDSDEALSAREEWKTVEEVEVAADAQPFVDAMPALRVLSSDRGRHVPSHPHLQELSLQHLLESEVAQLCSRTLPSLRSIAIVSVTISFRCPRFWTRHSPLSCARCR